MKEKRRLFSSAFWTDLLSTNLPGSGSAAQVIEDEFQEQLCPNSIIDDSGLCHSIIEHGRGR